MTYFLSGGAKNGKSTLAQNLAVAAGGKRYYIATMISSGEEDDARIRRHIADRAGLGFETVECFTNILDCLAHTDKNATFLVDSVTALMQNALFPAEKGYAMDISAAERCIEELVAFSAAVRNVIFVSDYICCDGMDYDETTKTYCRCLAEADRRLAEICDTVVEVCAGSYLVYKGALP